MVTAMFAETLDIFKIRRGSSPKVEKWIALRNYNTVFLSSCDGKQSGNLSHEYKITKGKRTDRRRFDIKVLR
jgi:hypothetical protein